MPHTRTPHSEVADTTKVLSANESVADLRVGRNTIYNLLNNGLLFKLDAIQLNA